MSKNTNKWRLLIKKFSTIATITKLQCLGFEARVSRDRELLETYIKEMEEEQALTRRALADVMATKRRKRKTAATP